MKAGFQLLLACALAAGAAAPALAGVGDRVGPFCSSEETWLVRSDAEEHGDRYVFASGISMDGVHHGDLLGFTQKMSIGGEVRGDVFAFANSVDITGTVRDSTRVFGQNIDIDGLIEGDLVVFAAVLNIKEHARITGSIHGSAAQFRHIGRVDGDVRLTSGESTIDGEVGGNLRLKADTIHFNEGARVDGDLIYTSRTELGSDVAEFVGGEVVYNPVEEEDEDDDEEFTLRSALFWFYWPLASFLAGALMLAFSGRHRSVPADRLDEEGWIGLAIGLFALPVLAVASVVGLVLLPVGLFGLLLVLVLAYIGKIPTAMWLGRRMLRLVGRPEPSPYGSLAIGLIVVYLLFSIPYVGLPLRYVATSAGIGALILGAVALRRDDAAAES